MCAVCGRVTDPDKLVEDNGKLVCPDCIKGARSRVDRAEGGAPLIDFKAPAVPMRRSRMIPITPRFLIGAIAAAIFVACQVYLTLVEKPRGTALARPTTLDKRGTPAVVPPDPDAAPSSTAPAPGTESASTQVSQATNPDSAVTPPPPASAPVVEEAPPPTSNPSVAIATPTAPPGPKSIFDDGNPANPASPTTESAAPAPPAAPEQPALPTDPLERGLTQLMARNYSPAAVDLDAARRKYVVGFMKPGVQLTPKQQVIQEGLAAAYLGLNHPADALAALQILIDRDTRSRAVALNRAIGYLMKRDANVQQIGQGLYSLKTYLDQHASDEYAADLFGSLLTRAAAMPNKDTKTIDDMWVYLDRYNDSMATALRKEGQLKWGVEWMDADKVKGFRVGRAAVGTAGASQEGALTAAAQDLEKAKRQVVLAERSAKNSRDPLGAQRTLDGAKANLAKAQQAFDTVSKAQNYEKPKWLDKFDPVLPESMPTQ
jgi:hypothetical protein